MKKWVMLIAMTMFFGLGVTVHAEVVDSGTCGESANWELDDAGTLTISGTGAMDGYEENNRYINSEFIAIGTSPWSGYRLKIKSLVVENGITEIGAHAFINCTSLEDVTLQDGLNQINYKAFYGCSSLKKIIIPDSVNEISGYGFFACTSLEEVRLPEGINTISEDLFAGCSFTQIDIPDSVKEIDGSAFYTCRNLTDFIIPSTVTKIGECVFKDCTSLKRITMPDNFNKIPAGFFQNCTSLENYIIQSKIHEIGSYAFFGCKSLENIDIPDRIYNVGEYAFADAGLTNINLYNNEIELGENSFGYYISNTKEEGGLTYDEYSLVPDFIVYANPNSTGQTYANNNGIRFSCITHTPIKIPAVAATEKTAGLTEGNKCSVCGEILTAQKVVPKLAHVHTPVAIPAVEPTEKSTGLTEGSKCSVCGQILKAQQVLPKIVIDINEKKDIEDKNYTYVLDGNTVQLKAVIKNVKKYKVTWSIPKKQQKWATVNKKTGKVKAKKAGNGHIIKADSWTLPTQAESDIAILLDDTTAQAFKDSAGHFAAYCEKTKLSFKNEAVPVFPGFEFFAYGLIEEGISHLEQLVKDLESTGAKKVLVLSAQVKYLLTTFAEKVDIKPAFEVIYLPEILESLVPDTPSYIYAGSFNLRYLCNAEELNKLIANSEEEQLKDSIEFIPLLKADRRVNRLTIWQKPVGAEYAIYGVDKKILDAIRTEAIEDIRKSNATQIVVLEASAYETIKKELPDKKVVSYLELL